MLKLDLRFVIIGIPNTRSPVERRKRGDRDLCFWQELILIPQPQAAVVSVTDCTQAVQVNVSLFSKKRCLPWSRLLSDTPSYRHRHRYENPQNSKCTPGRNFSCVYQWTKWCHILEYWTTKCTYINIITYHYSKTCFVFLVTIIWTSQWRTKEFCSGGGGFIKFSWGQRTERKGIWGL